jgi:hypothetical protein
VEEQGPVDVLLNYVRVPYLSTVVHLLDNLCQRVANCDARASIRVLSRLCNPNITRDLHSVL